MSSIFDFVSEEGACQFSLIGLAENVDFQKCLAIIEALHSRLPDSYLTPYIRPMLEFEWIEYLINARRRYGGGYWSHVKPFVVYANKKYLGDDERLVEFVSRRYNVKLLRNYQCLALNSVLDIYQKYMELGRKFIFLSVADESHLIGHMIFMLYADLVPKTCRNFIHKCKHNYKGVLIHRIMDRSWVQIGGFGLKNASRTCENYKIPHNRRGVISMCNDGRHTNNTTQFFICLNPTPWMDYRYVAFGQMVQGDNVLRHVESLKTTYETPTYAVISDCGEITFDDKPDKRNQRRIEKYFLRKAEGSLERVDSEVEVVDVRDVPSTLEEGRYKEGLYFFEGDLRPNLPLRNLESQTSWATKSREEDVEEEEDDGISWKISELEKDIINYDVPSVVEEN